MKLKLDFPLHPKAKKGIKKLLKAIRLRFDADLLDDQSVDILKDALLQIVDREQSKRTTPTLYDLNVIDFESRQLVCVTKDLTENECRVAIEGKPGMFIMTRADEPLGWMNEAQLMKIVVRNIRPVPMPIDGDEESSDEPANDRAEEKERITADVQLAQQG